MINGIINVYKEKGFTSHDVVAKLRGIAGQKKIGHTGTLDPDAEGVLPVCFGRATKVCDMLTDKDKTYEAVLLLGKSTDTQDISGTVLEEKEVVGLTEKAVEECILGYIGEYEQLPPMYSALKINGKKLYELAREGKVVERKTRKVFIHDIKIKEICLPRVCMEVHCSKGTYIRTLCYDIGEDLNTGGCMEKLLRTQVGKFKIEDSLRLSEIQKLKEEGKLSEIVTPVDEMFSEYPVVVVKGVLADLAHNGNPLKEKDLEKQTSDRIRVYDDQGRFIGIYNFDSCRKIYRLEKMFLDQQELRG